MADAPSLAIADFDKDRLQAQAAALEAAGYAVSTFGDGPSLLEHCRSHVPDLVVLEVFLLRMNGFETLKALRENDVTAGIPVLMLLDEDDAYGAHRARLCGADRVLHRPFKSTALVDAAASASLEASAGDPEDGAEQLGAVLDALEGRARAENPLIEHITDPLTGLYNRPYMELKLAEEFKKARRFQVPLTLVAIELDRGPDLRTPDETTAHRRLLNEVAGILLCESRDIDHLARIEDSEFLALLPHTPPEGATTMAGRILESVKQRSLDLAESGSSDIAAFAGIATYAGVDMESGEDLLDRAREALRRSRAQGPDRITCWTADTHTVTH